jgi:hypothetical protein
MMIIARDMYAAQGFTLSAEERAELVGRANRIRGILSAAEGNAVTDKQVINVPVRETSAGPTIGYLTYRF